MRNLILSIAIVTVVWPVMTVFAMTGSAMAVLTGCARTLADIWK